MNSATDPFFPKQPFVLTEAGKIVLQITAANDMPAIRVPMSAVPLHCFTTDQWRAYTRCFPVQRAIQMQAAWWKLELWSQAVRQNIKAN